MCLNNCLCSEARGYWKIGIQYLHLVEVVINETIRTENKAIVFSDDEELSCEQFEENTKWSDFNLIVPILFNFYHGIEVILKGFIIADKSKNENKHSLSELVAKFEISNKDSVIAKTAKKYIECEQLPSILKDFCKNSGIKMDDFYQALKYPESKQGNPYHHDTLTYKEEDGIPFFESLVRDIDEIRRATIKLADSKCQRNVIPEIWSP